ncbi:sulfotransferase [Aliifodinibius salicampi]|uniref:Sulfotransferase n=1 Tax=Fodinibius salicampi TaxID=1920655 RepID=A0ABT3PYS2_9BACT|nr:sulfotransferase [Fodinibius salicampi]MCW9712993.1 sulfotransferase [Fodinibius salicampi]
MLKEEIKYQDVTEKFEKDRRYEEFIEAFNNHLEPFEQEHYRELEETLPSVHVIGVPRSGTTLLTQLIYSHLDVGYINNLIARFWKAPVSAIRISKKLLGDNYSSTLSSDYGKTEKIYEPNEFNYLWYDLLSYDTHYQKTEEQAKDIDWERVGRTLKNMLWAYEKPIAFKSFMLGWHARRMQKTLNKTCFVWIKRAPIDTALSLLDLRRSLFGTVDRWASFKPQNFEQLRDLTPWEQVAGQVYYLEKAYHKQIDQLPESNYLVLQYEDVCRDPLETITAIKSLINNNGAEVHLTADDPSPQQPSKKKGDDYAEYEKVCEALDLLYK